MWSTQWTTLRAIAALLARLGRAEAAAVLVGAILTTESGHRLFGDDALAIAALGEELRDHLGAGRYDAALRVGASLDGDAAVEHALRSLWHAIRVTRREEVGYVSKLRWSRWSSVALVVAIAVPVAVVGSVSTSAAPPTVPELDWQRAATISPGRSARIATVPLDYDDPGAGTTEIALARYAATDAANRIGSVFVNPGGLAAPASGSCCRDSASSVGGARGTDSTWSGSIPAALGSRIHSTASIASRRSRRSLPPCRWTSRRSGPLSPVLRRLRGLGPECRDDEPITEHMNTADVARDMDLLRQAVGDARLSYLGFSYGSYLGNTYANLFPRNIRAW